jgi:mono/diheme cytochrome c family protein
LTILHAVKNVDFPFDPIHPVNPVIFLFCFPVFEAFAIGPSVTPINLTMKRHIGANSGWIAISLVAAALVGCGAPEPPPFRLDMTKIVANQIIPKHQQAIADVLDAMFGTPDEPYALPETGLDLRKLKMAAGPVWSNQVGGKHGLYRRYCAHCHGISGDGRGPTAMILNPYPRDYRPGVFKFKTTYNPNQPSDDDLHTILHNGIPGTAMPSFAVYAPDEVDACIEYVKYLSMRGQMENALINYVKDELSFNPVTGEGDPLDPAKNEDQRKAITTMLTDDVVAGWKDANENVIRPDDGKLPPKDRTAKEIAASATKGRDLFYGTKANCVKCHGPTALGDGQQDDYDNWSKATKKFEDETAMLPATIKSLKEDMAKPDIDKDKLEEMRGELKAKNKELVERDDVIAQLLPPRNAIPRNLRDGVFRGGRRPWDIYHRVNQGISGTPMPGGGPASAGAQGTLSDEEIWSIVDYVKSVAFEPASVPQTKPMQLDAIVK